MDDVLRFAVLGLGPAAVYALAGHGIVAIRLGSGILNFAHGALALVAASVFVTTRLEWGWPTWAAFASAVVVGGLVGFGIHCLVDHPLRRASDLVRLVANVGVFVGLTQVVLLWKGSEQRIVPSFYPAGTWHLGVGSVSISSDRLVMVAIAGVLTLTLWYLFQRTRSGLGVRAAAADPVAAASLGYSPWVMGAGTWTLGGVLAAMAGVLVLPISGFAPFTLVLLVLPAFSAALIGGLQSFPACMGGALLVGIGQSLLVRFAPDTIGRIPGLDGVGWADATPFLVVVVVLCLRTPSFVARGQAEVRLPQVPRSPSDLRWITAWVVIGVTLSWIATGGLLAALTTSAVAVILMLSLVLIVGCSGQLSMGQLAIAGLAALVAARTSDMWSLPFVLAGGVGIVTAVVAAAIMALPAFRTRGPALMVITLGLAVAVEKVVFANSRYTGGSTGVRSGPAEVFGWSFDASTHPERFATVAVIVAGLGSVLVGNVRVGSFGRQLLAVRSGNRAARCRGVDAKAVQLLAFVGGGLLAGVAGLLNGFRFASVNLRDFAPLMAVSLLVLIVMSGVGSLAGAAVAGLLVPGGVVEHLAGGGDSADNWIALGTSVALIVVLILRPDGLVVRRRSKLPRAGLWGGSEPERVQRTLSVSNLHVHFGGVVAVADLSLEVSPGKVVGLIGPNGAGKSTVVDAISGIVASTGSVRLGDTELSQLRPHQRARAGLARTFQHMELFNDLTVAENVAVSAERPGWREIAELVAPRAPRLSEKSAALLDEFGLRNDLDRLPTDLPHGRQRLLGLAQAVAAGGAVVLLDEPAAGLDDEEAAELQIVIRRLAADGVGVLLIEHRLDLVFAVSDHIVALDRGIVVFSGPPEAARTDRQMLDSYLGPGALQPVDAVVP